MSNANTVQMPPLPEPFMDLNIELTSVIYDAWAAQMHTYAQAYAAYRVVEIEAKLAALLEYRLNYAKESAEYMEMLHKYLPAVGVFARLETQSSSSSPDSYTGHDSDCAVHNMPAYPAAPCDCKLSALATKEQP